jgi:hypothetical protein
MAGTREYSSNPSRRAVVGAGGALLGANFLSSPAKAALAQLKLSTFSTNGRFRFRDANI